MASRISLIALLTFLLLAPLLARPSQLALSQKMAERNQQAPGGREREAEALHQQARLLLETGQYGLAHIRLFEAAQLWRQANQPERAIRALLQLAENDQKAHRWQAALQCYRQLLQIPSLSGQVKVSSLNSMALLYTQLHQFHLATEHYQQALRLARKLKDHREETSALIGLAEVSVEQREIADAQSRLEQARQLAEQTKDKKALGAALSLAGQAYRAQGQMVVAREALEQSLRLQREMNDQESETQSLCLLSDLNLNSGQLQASLDQANQAVKLANLLKISELQWRAYQALGRAQRAMGRLEEAVKSYYRVFSHIEKQRLLHFSADAFKITLLAERQAPYRELADLLIECGRADEAFAINEYARSRATLDLLANARRNAAPLRSPASNAALREPAQNVARLRAELRSGQLHGQQEVALQAELAEAERRLEEARWAAEMECLNNFALPTTLKEAQKMMRRPEEALLEFCLGEKRSYVWLISAEEVRWAVLPGQAEIEEKVRSYLESLSARPRRVALEREAIKQKRLGEQLFDLLLGQFAKALASCQRLTIAPDGLLYYLPFETLVRDGRYLIERYEIHYVPSASVLGLLSRSRKSVDRQAQMELLVFGDPAFAPSKTPGGGKNPTGDVSQRFWSSSGMRLPSLPNTGAEATFISELFSADRRQTYLGRAATEEALKRESLDRYRRIHFATHSLIDEQFPARSGIALALANEPQEDGLLEVAEIAELKLDSDLVVLSACQTGRGSLVRGEGVVGLSRAFLYAGSRSVAVSLWNVSDISTARLMQSFYRHLATGDGMAAALRQAKLEMIERGNVTSHPYFWAPFVLVGNPQ